jgi:hypothetical protein
MVEVIIRMVRTSEEIARACQIETRRPGVQVGRQVFALRD